MRISVVILKWFILTAVFSTAAIFFSAGRYDWPVAWAYVAVVSVIRGGAGLMLDPDLIKERERPGSGGKKQLLLRPALPLVLFVWILAGLDVGRYHWSDTIPLALQIVGLVGVALFLGLFMWAMTVNRFFSTVIRIQHDRGHRVIDSGPYRLVRHPGYAGLLGFFPCTSLALNSWVSMLVALTVIPAIFYRTALEDRTLQQDLQGYADYARKVRYRLVPGVW